jgi:hypothetical protein
MLGIHCVLYYFQLSLSWTLTSLLAAFGCCMQFMYYTILASRFVTILGKKRGPKGNNHWRKTEIEASLDLILIWWKERELLQRERGKRRSEKAMPIWPERDRTELSRTTKRGLVLSHAVPFYQPHTTRPHMSAQKRTTKRNPPVRAPSEGFRQWLGKTWGKTKELGKTEYN